MGIEEQIDRLIDLGEDIKSSLDLLVEMASDHFAGADKMVAEKPAKEPEPEHPAGPMPDPGEGYRLLSKDPPEDLSPGDEYFYRWDGLWRESLDASKGIREQGEGRWYRRKIEPAKSLAELIHEPIDPILPEVGDWVRVTRPEDWREWKDPLWQEDMHQYDGKIFQIGNIFEMSVGERVRLKGIDWFFHRDWLTFAEPPEPEYREPVLPADAGKPCEFSITGKDWYSSLLAGFQVHNNHWISSDQGRWNFARIKKDA